MSIPARLPAPRTHRGASTVGIIVTLVILLAVGLVGFHFYSTYKVLDRAKTLEKSLETVHRYRGANRVTPKRIVDTVLAAVRKAGGKVEARDVKLQLAPLTLSNGNSLSKMQRYKLTMECHLKGVGAVRNNRIDRIKAAVNRARRGTPTPPATPSSVAPPAPGGNIGCSAEELEDLDYTFVQVTLGTRVKYGWVTRAVRLKRSFFLTQSASDPEQPDSETDDDEDDE